MSAQSSNGPDLEVTPARVTATAGRRRGVVPDRREFLTPVHGVLNVLHVLGEHALLGAWFVLGYRLLPLAAYLAVSPLACLVHQRAMSEWIHEGAHYNLVPNRRWNDLLTDVLAGIWFGVPVRVYRATHFAHHAQPDFFVPTDPDTDFLDVTSRQSFRRGVARDMTGLTMIIQFRRFREKSPAHEWRWRAVAMIVYLGVAAGALLVGRLDVPILYYVTLATLYPLLNRLRVYGQHVTLEDSGRSIFTHSSTSRTIDAGVIDRIVHTSPRLMYHHEHHAYPHLPYRALRGLVVRDAGINRYARSRWGILRAAYRGLPG
jgi:fatty acid desaturase